ncbi:MAG TPA: VOC family protein [Tepidiformaceae bacterium]|nr:VOC family protein [Tepidiformaceae bacterium]
MAITLNHTIVPAHDKHASADFFARVMGLAVESAAGHFVPVKITDSLTFDFDNSDAFESHHYAFRVGDDEFEEILARVQSAGVAYFADPGHRRAGEFNSYNNGRGFYFSDPNGHNLEVGTRL